MDLSEQIKENELVDLRNKLDKIFTIVTDANPDFKEITDYPTLNLLDQSEQLGEYYDVFNDILNCAPVSNSATYRYYKKSLEDIENSKKIVDGKIDEIRKKNLEEVQTIESIIEYLDKQL
ncbi:hypothetical protein IGI71_001605 [Enterococcus sp. DIV1279b]|uniref:hypothetical protein n=1 Tax=Enterococcus TaxID=1350 RepID=UPI0039A783A2